MFSTLIFCSRPEFFQLITLIIETFARQTFANFASFRFFRESLCRENLKTAIRESLSREFFSTFQLKISWFFQPPPSSTEILKGALFSADSFFLHFSLHLECNTKEQIQELMSPFFEYGTGDSRVFIHTHLILKASETGIWKVFS